MQCLVFAHRGEAQIFLEKLPFEPIKNEMNLYQTDEQFLFIIGEGIFETLCKITSILTKYSQITQIFNFGVAGSLNPKLKLMETYSIRSIYSSLNNQFQFKSFTSSDLSARIDAISTDYRIKEQEDKNSLLAYAQIVDRELWAIAFAANKFKIPWRSIKCISDESIGTYSCQSIKEQAREFSLNLYNSWLKTTPLEALPESIPLPDSFYFTFSQEKRYQKLIKKYSLKISKQVPDLNIELDQLFNDTSPPKKRTQKLLQYLSELINPIHFKAKENIENQLKHLKKNDIKYQYDPQLESSSLEIRAKFKNTEEKNSLIKALNEFNHKDFEDSFKRI